MVRRETGGQGAMGGKREPCKSRRPARLAD